MTKEPISDIRGFLGAGASPRAGDVGQPILTEVAGKARPPEETDRLTYSM